MNACTPVAVVIPAYNAERFLADALRSVQTQSAPVADVIVVDDGSTDRTFEIAQRLGARALRQTNQGVSAARNAGIRAANQPWIAFLDADDTWEPDKIERQWAAVQQYPEAGLISCDVRVFRGEDEVTASCLDRDLTRQVDAATQCSYFPKPGGDFLVKQMNYFPSAVLVRREALWAAGLFNEKLRYNEDFDCFLQVLARWPLAMVERPLVRHRLHAGNASRNTCEMALSYAETVARMAQYPSRYPSGVRPAYQRETQTLLIHTGRSLLADGRRAEARRLFARSLSLSPGFSAFFHLALTLAPPALTRFCGLQQSGVTERQVPA